MAAPTGDELVAQAEQHYLDYRGVTNDVQALIFDGPWPVEVGTFGMQPSGAGCPDGSYKFDLARSTEVDPAPHAALSESVREHLIELSELMFGEATLSEGYLPREESPSDPLFFGVTPGEPAFGPTPKPTATP